MIGRTIGSYEIVAKLGEGGMGEVYRAKDTRLGREVAIKILPAELVNDPERRSRFEREAQAISALNHPHIVTLHEVGTSDAGPYLVLERIDGQSLRELLAAGPVPVRRLTAIAAQVADGLAKAHAAGIVHRDLKPDNVMVTADGFAKILDFGLAKLAWPGIDGGSGEDTTFARDTKSGLILGTLGYLSPEQAAGRPADFRADQFALGALLYEMATGERPFRRGTMAESLAATIRDEPEPLRSKRADVPQPLAWVVERCLAKDPNDRYASTRDLARDLTDIRDRLSDLQKAPVEGAAAGARRRPAARHRWLIAVGVAAALVAAGYWGARLTERSDEAPTYRPLTFQRGIITGAKFSRDGNTVYYSAAFGDGPSQVFVTRLDGTGAEALKLPPAHLLSVSRTGELAVLLTSGRNTANSVGMLAHLPPIGGTPRPLLDDVVTADWAPDGKRLAVERRDGSVEFPIGRRIQSGSLMPKVSPRGDRVAWIIEGGVQIADPEGYVLVNHKIPFAFGLAWRPDGQELWFTGSEAGGGYDRALYALSLDGKRRIIARVPGALTVWDVPADGRGALVSTGSGWFNIVASRQGDKHERSLDLFGRSEVVSLSADGERLLLNETREVGMGIYLRTTDGEPPIKLGDRPRALGLTPDGGSALVWETDPIRLSLIPTSAGTPRDVPVPPGSEPFPRRGGARWSSDGRRLFVKFIASDRGEASARVFMREGDRDWRPVTPEGVGGAFVVSSDGGRVAIGDATGDISLYDVEGGPPRRLAGERGTPIYWSTDDRWLYLRRGGFQDVPAEIYRRELATGRVEEWRKVGPSDMSGVSSVSNPLLAQDGAVVVYIYARISSELFYVRGLR